MKRKFNSDSIVSFVAMNPGCLSSLVVKSTGIERGSVISALNRLTKDGTLRRESAARGFIYFVGEAANERAKESKRGNQSPKLTGAFGCANPLTQMFNRCLMEARSCQ